MLNVCVIHAQQIKNMQENNISKYVGDAIRYMTDCTHISLTGLQIHIITDHKTLADRIYCLICDKDFTRVEYDDYIKDLKVRKENNTVVRMNVKEM